MFISASSVVSIFFFSFFSFSSSYFSFCFCPSLTLSFSESYLSKLIFPHFSFVSFVQFYYLLPLTFFYASTPLLYIYLLYTFLLCFLYLMPLHIPHLSSFPSLYISKHLREIDFSSPYLFIRLSSLPKFSHPLLTFRLVQSNIHFIIFFFINISRQNWLPISQSDCHPLCLRADKSDFVLVHRPLCARSRPGLALTEHEFPSGPLSWA